jgi:uncharacterized protein (TIGR03435 family)
MIRKSTWPPLAVVAAVIIAWAAPGFTVAAQTGAAGRPELTFEVASIKPAPPSTPMQTMHGNARIGMKVDAARVDIANLALLDLIRIAYGVKPYQIIAPAWMGGGQRWDIQAKLPERATPQQIPAMLQALLAERFKLVVHRETKEHAVYGLVVGKSGPKMKEADLGDMGHDAGPKPHQGDMTVGHGPAAGMPISGDAMNVFLTSETIGPAKVSPVPGGGGMRLEAQKASMAALADMLSRIVDRPVVDMTGLKGKYEIVLDLTQENMRTMATTAGFATAGMGLAGRGTEGGMHGGGDGATGSEPGTTVFQSVQQLGLKLEARRAPIETIVVDGAERIPTGN